MIHNFTVTPAPAPVMPTQININVQYVVVRGDGLCRTFHSLYETNGRAPWALLGAQSFDISKTILIPIDLFTAARLGLVSFDELELPEGMKALINMIK